MQQAQLEIEQQVEIAMGEVKDQLEELNPGFTEVYRMILESRYE